MPVWRANSALHPYEDSNEDIVAVPTSNKVNDRGKHSDISPYHIEEYISIYLHKHVTICKATREKLERSSLWHNMAMMGILKSGINLSFMYSTILTCQIQTKDFEVFAVTIPDFIDA